MPVRTLRDPARVTVEVAISKITGRVLLCVDSSGVEQFYAEGIQELVIDLGREDLLVIRPGSSVVERRTRE